MESGLDLAFWIILWLPKEGRYVALKKSLILGHLDGSVIERLPLAQVVILGSWDQVPHQAPRREPASLSAYVSAFLSVSLMNK